MIIKGRVWKFGDDIDTDAIIPARYLNTSDPAELAKHVMEDADKTFSSKVQKGDIIVAGKNFGCGSSREHAPIAIKASGVQTVIAKSFARIFFRNSFNIGLPIFETADVFDNVAEGETVEVDTGKGVVRTAKGEFQVKPIPPFMNELISAGGLVEWTKKKLAGRPR
ncbi:MAG: 3-isopropylmalate dehydratase small subunit [Nitrospiraceae bacterium]|nr:3-isopropylmalate dehydratase small subunit [Nitrospiraceae bacterium]